MIQPLRDLAEVRAGHPFRGSVPVVNDGNAQVIQMRDVAPDGAVAWPALVRTRVAAHRSARLPDWLQDGDVLFAARGGRNYAVCLAQVPAATVCAQYFFVLRLKTDLLLPEFLAWTINRAPCQRYLTRLAEGSDQLSIRRPVLEDLPVAVPDLARQRLRHDQRGHGLGRVGVQRGGGLIGQQQRRVGDQGAGNGHTLHLPAAQVGGHVGLVHGRRRAARRRRCHRGA